MDRVFLDANVLFSAAYRPSSRIRQLWSLPGVMLVSSNYAIEEARRNLLVHRPQSLSELDALIEQMEIVCGSSSEVSLSDAINLPEKDIPIIAAAAESDCAYLLTGDKQHFDALFGQSVGGVLVLLPGEYIRRAGLSD
ncbi:MAG: PIN domain-containing protein [Armatimonadota bacterium]